MARSRKAERAARRAERSGAGPVREGYDPGRNPGAVSAFGLLGEVMMTGLLVTIVGLLVVTLPAGLAAGIRHLRRFVAAEDSRPALFWADVRAGILPGTVVGVIAAGIAAVLGLDILLASGGALPGGEIIAVVGWVGLALLATAVLLAAGAWRPEHGWRGAVRAIPAAVRADVAGALYVVATAVFVGVATWALIPLFIPAIGCAALAVVAIPARARGRSAA
jgi:hypothetical protein